MFYKNTAKDFFFFFKKKREKKKERKKGKPLGIYKFNTNFYFNPIEKKKS